MKMRSVMPAPTASSTAYWMSGLSTMGSISLGEAFVAGRKRVPRPATGKTALVTFCIRFLFLLFAQELQEPLLVEDLHVQLAGLVELGAGVLARDHEVRLLRHRSRDLAAAGFDALLGVVAGHRREGSGEDHDFTREGPVPRGARGLAPL